MYEQFKNQLALSLSSIYSREEIEVILRKVDIVSYDYEIVKKETSVVVYNSGMPEIVKTYLICKKVEGMSEQTLYNYGKTLQKFFFQLQKPPELVTSNDIRVYLYRYQETKKITNRSLDKIRQTICCFFSWASSEGYLSRNPATIIKPIKYEKKERKPLTQIELEYIRQSCNTLREKAMIEFMYSTGCRVSELAIVKKSDVNWQEKSVHLFGKGKKHRTSYLNAKAEVSLINYLNSRNDNSEYLFVTIRKPYRMLKKCAIQKIVRDIAERTSAHVNKPVSPHVFRHTTASTALNNGMPIENIRILLGHEKIETTLIYAKSLNEKVISEHKRCII